MAVKIVVVVRIDGCFQGFILMEKFEHNLFERTDGGQSLDKIVTRMGSSIKRDFVEYFSSLSSFLKPNVHFK